MWTFEIQWIANLYDGACVFGWFRKELVGAGNPVDFGGFPVVFARQYPYCHRITSPQNGVCYWRGRMNFGGQTPKKAAPDIPGAAFVLHVYRLLFGATPTPVSALWKSRVSLPGFIHIRAVEKGRSDHSSFPSSSSSVLESSAFFSVFFSAFSSAIFLDLADSSSSISCFRPANTSRSPKVVFSWLP